MYYFIKNLLLYIRAWISQTMYMYIVIMTKEGPTKNVNLMTPTTGFLCYGMDIWVIYIVVNMHCLQSTLSICSTLIVVVHVFRGSWRARAWPKKSYCENALFFKKSSSLHPIMDQTNYVYSNDDQGREEPTKFGNFMTPRTGVVVLGCGKWIIQWICIVFNLLFQYAAHWLWLQKFWFLLILWWGFYANMRSSDKKSV